MESISTVVCSHQRVIEVETLLSDLGRIVPRADVLFVDSGSMPSNQERFREIARSAGARYARSDQAGLGAARLVAMANANSEWLLFLDDDVRIDDNFAAGYELLSSGALRGYSFCAGRILLPPETPLPEWVPSEWEWVFSLQDLGVHDRALLEGELPMGACFAVRRTLLERRNFSSELGRREDSLLGGEETELFNYWSARGEKCYYIASLSVAHCVGSRLTLEYWLRASIGVGLTMGQSSRGAKGMLMDVVGLVGFSLLTSVAAVLRRKKFVSRCAFGVCAYATALVSSLLKHLLLRRSLDVSKS